MIVYSVTIALAPEIESQWLEWMKRVHVPDVLGTGCFLECRMHKAVQLEGNEPTYVLQYHCRSLADYERYRDNFAPALQKEHTDLFSGRFRGSRQVLEEVARYPLPESG